MRRGKEGERGDQRRKAENGREGDRCCGYEGLPRVNTQALPLSSEPCPAAPDPHPGLQAVSWGPALKQGVK